MLWLWPGPPDEFQTQGPKPQNTVSGLPAQKEVSENIAIGLGAVELTTKMAKNKKTAFKRDQRKKNNKKQDLEKLLAQAEAEITELRLEVARLRGGPPPKPAIWTHKGPPPTSYWLS